MSPHADPEACLSAAPNPLVALIATRAVNHMEARRFDRARDALLLLTQMRPEQDASWAALAIASRQTGRLTAALDAIRRAVELDPNSREHAMVLGELLCVTGEPARGVAMIRDVFGRGRDLSEPPARQDPLTRRAGMIIEGIQKGLKAGTP